jgi:hypothetical protein
MKLFRDAPQHTEHNNALGPKHSFHKEAHGHRNLLFFLSFFKLSILVESSPDSCSLLFLLSLPEKVYVVNEAARRPLFTRRRRKALASDKASRFCKIPAVPTGGAGEAAPVLLMWTVGNEEARVVNEATE